MQPWHVFLRLILFLSHLCFCSSRDLLLSSLYSLSATESHLRLRSAAQKDTKSSSSLVYESQYSSSSNGRSSWRSQHQGHGFESQEINERIKCVSWMQCKSVLLNSWMWMYSIQLHSAKVLSKAWVNLLPVTLMGCFFNVNWSLVVC